MYIKNKVRYYFPFPVDLGGDIEVSEEEFFNLVGFDRQKIPFVRNKNNINRKDFYFENMLLAYSVKTKEIVTWR